MGRDMLMYLHHSSHCHTSVLYYIEKHKTNSIEFVLKTRDFVEKLKFFPRLPHTQVAHIICSDQISYALLKGQKQNRVDRIRKYYINK